MPFSKHVARKLNVVVQHIFSRRCSTYQEKAFRPLQNVKVLDLTRILAGPYCTMILGDLGADIYKVERLGCGDDTRSWGPPWVKGDHSAYYLSINRNKKSVAVDLQKKEGAHIIKEMANVCDVVIENYLPGKLRKYGLGYEDLKQHVPGIIYVSITGFGQSGPYAQRPGYDNIAAAIGGLMHITGPEGGEPCRVGVAMTDLSTGLYAVVAILSALMHRQATGQGQHIDCNLLNTQVATLTHIASNYLNCGVEARRYGTGHPSIVPYQAFQTKDSYIMIGAGNDRLFEDMCQKMDLSYLLADPRFKTNSLRVKNRQVLLAALSKRFSEKTTEHWMEIFQNGLCPYGPINNMKQVFSDPQVVHNNIVQEMIHPQLGNIRVPGPAVNYGAGETVVRYPPPLLGEHTDEVLQELLGLTGAEIDQLRQKNVIN